MMTSWPGPTSSARSASSSAALPELTAAAAPAPRRSASPRSNAILSGPCTRWPPRTTRATLSASPSTMVGRECGIIGAGSLSPVLREGGLKQTRVAPTRPASEIQEQSDRLERLRVFDPGLNAPKIGARPRQLQDRQVLDVGLRHLRPVRLEAGQLRVQHTGDVRVTVRREIHRRRHLVKEEVWHVAGRRHRALGQVAMVLVRIIG